MEFARRQPAANRPAAVLSQLVVSRLGGPGPLLRADRRLSIPPAPMEPGATGASGLRAAVDRLPGKRAQTHRRRVARQPGPAPAHHEEPGAAGVAGADEKRYSSRKAGGDFRRSFARPERGARDFLCPAPLPTGSPWI